MPDHHPLDSGDPCTLGDYTLLGRLAAGGQGVVYLGLSAQGRTVAVKLLHDQWMGSSGGRYTLQREVDAARRVAPFCTAQILDAQLTQDPQYIVSEYIDGPPLSHRVTEHGPLAGPALDRLAIATITALVAIHRAGVVHRDLKPANILLGPDGARVIDFGIARQVSVEATQTQSLRGTPLYMAPEQFAGQPASPASDVFAWAATMAYAATGRAAFAAPTVVAVAQRITAGQADLDGVPAPLLDVLRSCLAREPGQRPDAPQVLMALLGHPLTETVDPGVALAAATRAMASTPVPAAQTLTPTGLTLAQLTPPGVTPGGLTPDGLVPAAAASAGEWQQATRRVDGTPPATPGSPGGGPSPGRRRLLLAAAGLAVIAVAVGAGMFLAEQRHPGATTAGSGSATTGVAAPPTPSASAADTPTTTDTPTTAGVDGTSGAAGSGPGTQGALTVPASAAGVWTGTMSQAGVLSWTGRVTLTAGSGSGVLEAVELGCRSQLTLVGRAGAALTFRQILLPGSGPACAKGGTLTVTPQGSAMGALWQDTTSTTNTAIGTLERG